MRLQTQKINTYISKILALTLAVTVLGTPLNPVSYALQPAAHATETTPSAEATSLWEQVKDEYQTVTALEVGRHVGVRTRSTEYAEANRVYRERNNGQTPTPQQLQEIYLEFGVKDVGYDKSVPKAQADLNRLMPLLIDTMNPAERNAETLRNKKLDLLSGLAYLYRYYDFSFGNQHAIDSILFDNTAPADEFTTAYNRVLNIRGINGFLTIGVQTTEIYARYIARYTGYPTVTTFIEAKLNQYAPGKTPQQWLTETSKGIIYDTQTRSLWTKFVEDENMRDYLLPILTLSDNSLYIGNLEFSIQFGLTSTYGGADNPNLRTDLEKTINNNQRFTDFWKRISRNQGEWNYKGHVIVNDTWAKPWSQQNQTIASRWARPYADGADAALLDLFYNMQIRNTAQNVGAVASGTHINFYLLKALGTEGTSTYAHEMTHIYDGKVWFNGQGRRAMMRVEDYARGLFETEDATPKPQSTYPPMFNLNLAYDLGENRLQNMNPERFQTTDDLLQYSRGLMDVINSLDVMEALETLKLPAADKALLYNKVEAKPNTQETWSGRWLTVYENSWKDVFSKLTPAEAENLRTIEDLVDKQISSAKYFPAGITTSAVEVPVNQYVVIPLFEPIYAGLDATNEGTGSVMFRRYAYDILGEYGWDDGFIAYLSGKYANEQAALKAILTKHGGNLRTFKKDMYNRRLEKLADMKPVAGYENAAAMQEAIRNALVQDLETIKTRQGASTDPAYGANAVREVKKAILTTYLNSTNDFRTSIYKEKIKWELPVTAEVQIAPADENRTAKAGEFKITVTPGENNPGEVTGVPTGEIPVAAGGIADLSKWQFTTPGTYTFSVTQVPGSDVNLTYDRSTVTATVTIPENAEIPAGTTQDSDGNYLLTPQVTYTSGRQQTTGIRFTNTITRRTVTYTPPAIPVTLKENDVDKAFVDADFLVEMTLTSGENTAVTGIPTEQIGNSGARFSFPELTITRPGTYTITYRQVPQTDANITYDTVNVVQTLVVENHSTDAGSLQVTSTYTKGGKSTQTPSFNNLYRTPAPVVTYTETTEKVVIPVETEEIEDPQLPVGEQQVTEGTPGERTIVKRQRLENGQPVGEPEIVSETVTTPMRKRVIRRGTKPVFGFGKPATIELPVFDISTLNIPVPPVTPSVSAGVSKAETKVVAPSALTLPQTGSTAGWLALAGVALAAIGGLSVYLSRRNKK